MGANPVSLALDPRLGELVAADLGSGTDPALSVINASLGRLLATVPWGAATLPSAAAIAPAVDRLYVADFVEDEVRVYNLSSLQLNATIAVGEEPNGLAFDPLTGRLFVTNAFSDNVSVVDTATDAVVGSLGGIVGPDGLAVAPSAGLLFVSVPADDQVDVLNATSLSWVVNRSVGISPAVPYYDAELDRVLVPDSGGDNLTVLNASSGALAGSWYGGVAPDAVTSDANASEVFVGSGRAASVLAETENGTRLANLSLGSASGPVRAIVDDPSDARVYVGLGDAANISVIGVRSLAALPSISLGARPGPDVYDPAAGRLVQTDAMNRSVDLVPLPALGPMVPVALPAVPSAVVLGPPDTSLLIFEDSDEVAMLNDTTGALADLGQLAGLPSAEAFDAASGLLFVGLPANDSVQLVEPSHGVRPGLFPVGSDPADVVVVPPRGEVAVTNAGSGNLSLLNGSTGAPSGSIDTGGTPGLAVYDPVDDAIAYADEASGALESVDLASASVAPIGNGTWYPSALVADPVTGDLLLATTGPGAVDAIDWQNGSLEQSVPTALGTDGIAIDPVDGLILAANEGAGSVSVIPEPELGPGAPEYTLHVGVDPGLCGPVTIRPPGGSPENLSNGSTLEVSAGTLALAAPVCPTFLFDGWDPSPELAVALPRATATNATVEGPGAIVADYVRAPILEVRMALVPAGCGPVTLNGSQEANDSLVAIREGAYVLGILPCAGEVLLAVNGTANITVVRTSSDLVWDVVIGASGTLTVRWGPPAPTGARAAGPPWAAAAEIAAVLGGIALVLIAVLWWDRHRPPPPVEPTGPRYPERVDAPGAVAALPEPSSEDPES